MGRHKEPVSDHLGNQYSSVDEMCAAYEKTVKMYRTRIYRGWTQEEALTSDSREVIHSNCDESDRTDFLGNVFPSESEMCRFHGTTYKLYYMRKAAGHSACEALQPNCKFVGTEFARTYSAESRREIKSGMEGLHILQNCGLVGTLVKFRTVVDIDVKLEDDTLIEHTTYAQFVTRHTLNPNSGKGRLHGTVGQRRMMKMGQGATLIEKLGPGRTARCLVRLDDGTELTVPYESWTKGKINYSEQLVPKLSVEDIMFKTNRMHCGMDCTVVGGDKVKHLTVQFEDGQIVQNVAGSTFQAGEICHPTFRKPIGVEYRGYTIKKRVFVDLNKTAFYLCEKDGKEYILNPREMFLSSNVVSM